MMWIIIFAVAVLIAAGVMGRKKNGRGSCKEGRKGVGQEPIKETPEVIEAKRELYQYLNQAIKKMFLYYRRNNWGSLSRFAPLPADVKKYGKEIRRSLSDEAATLLEEYFSCVETGGTEEAEPGTITNQKN